VDARSVNQRRADLLPGAGNPDAAGAVLTSCQDGRAIGAKSHSRYGVSMVQATKEFSRYVPEARGLIAAARDDRRILGAKSYGVNGALMAKGVTESFSGVEVPELSVTVLNSS